MISNVQNISHDYFFLTTVNNTKQKCATLSCS